MKAKKLLALALSCVCALGAFALAGCSGGSDASSDGSGSSAGGAISVISREDGSGTRGAFTELFEIEDADGNDATTTSAVVTNSTSVMMTTVAGDPNSIGYISLGSLNDTVKAVEIDGVAPSADGVKDGSYKVARPFNVVAGQNLSDVAQDFLNFIMSSDGQAVVSEENYVSVADDAQPYTASGKSGKVVVAGSSSVTPVMEKLVEAYQALNPDVNIEVQQSDSSTGVQSAIDGTCDLGMASRELKDSETSQGVKPVVIAMDGIAVVVNNDSAVNGLTSEQVKGIFTGEITDWSNVA